MPPNFDLSMYCTSIGQRMTEYTERELERSRDEAKAKEDIAAQNAAYVFHSGITAAMPPGLAEDISKLDAA